MSSETHECVMSMQLFESMCLYISFSLYAMAKVDADKVKRWFCDLFMAVTIFSRYARSYSWAELSVSLYVWKETLNYVNVVVTHIYTPLENYIQTKNEMKRKEAVLQTHSTNIHAHIHKHYTQVQLLVCVHNVTHAYKHEINNSNNKI